MGTPPAPPPTPLDPEALARLRELDPDGRHGVLERVLNAFELSLARSLLQLAAAAAAPAGGDAQAVSNIAHMLKSSSASVGALALAQSCADVESSLRQGLPVPLSVHVERLRADGEAALVVVRAMLRP